MRAEEAGKPAPPPVRRPPVGGGGKRAGLNTRWSASLPSRGLRFRMEVTSSITEFNSYTNQRWNKVYVNAMLRIQEILVQIQIYCRSAVPYLGLIDQDADPDPAFFVIDLQDINGNFFLSIFLFVIF